MVMQPGKIFSILLLFFISTSMLCAQCSRGLKVYGLYRVFDEISLGVTYHLPTALSLSFEGGYNIRIQKQLEINGTEFGFEDYYSLPKSDYGPVLRMGFNVHTGDFGFVKVAFLLKNSRVEHVLTDPGFSYRDKEHHLESRQYGLDINYHLIVDRLTTLFWGVSYRYAVFDFNTYLIDGVEVDESFQKEGYYPAMNVGITVRIKEWDF